MSLEKRHGDTAFLDGLRGLAAFAVVLSHLIYWFYPEGHIGARAPSPSTAMLWLFNSPFSFFYKGGFAVAVFFVLSGFVLTRACMRKNNSTYTAKAALKRYLRLGGPVFATVLICALMREFELFPATDLGIKTYLSGAYSDPPEWVDAARSALYGAMLYGDRSYDYVLWTISIEFYGSLLIFSAFALFGFEPTLLRKAVAILAALFALQMGEATYYFMFFAGSFFATLDWRSHRNGKGRMLTASMLILFGLYMGGYAPASASYSLISHSANSLQKLGILTLNWPILFSGLGAVLLIYGTLSITWVQVVLSSSPCVWLGKISFSLYLLHSLVLTAIAPWIIKYLGFTLTSFLISVAATSLVTFAMSYIFWKKVDLKFTQMADDIANRCLPTRFDRLVADGR